MGAKKVSVVFHRVEQAGFYPWGRRNRVLGDLNETFEALRQWGRGKRFSLTRLVDRRGEEDLPVYLLGIEQVGRDWVFATWNRVPDAEGKIPSISMNSVVGDRPQIHLNEIQEDTIPGFATYFWVVPEHDVVATVRIETRATGKDAMRGYVERFLETESGYVVSEAERGVVGYRALDKRGDILKVRPMFRLSPFVKPGPINYIRRHREQIVRVIRTGHLEAANAQERQVAQGLFAWFRGARRDHQLVDHRRVQLELDFTPSADELDAMIEAELEADAVSAWDDLGFQLAGDMSTTHWVGRAVAGDSPTFDLPDAQGGVYDLGEIGRELAARRRDLFKTLDHDG